jgi:hypothetical protein
MPVPNPVRNATLAVWAILALVVLRVILTAVFRDDLVDAWIEDNAPGLPREIAAEGAPAYTGVALVSLVITALLAFAAINLPKGANWARVVAMVFAALSLLGVLLAFLAPSLVILQVINVVVAVLSIAVIVLLVTAESNRFFSAKARAAR